MRSKVTISELYYSKHHAAKRYDLEFGSHTTEIFENSLKNLKNHEAHLCMVGPSQVPRPTSKSKWVG